MGKKARIRARRLAEAHGNGAKGAKSILEQINALDAVIAESTAELITLEGQKAEMLANMCIESDGSQPGHRSMDLGDLLNPDQIQAVLDILNRPNLDDIAIAKLLKQYLAKFSQQLSAVGLEHTYLAYMILARKDQLRAMSAQSNDKPDEPYDPFQPDRLSRN
jgi:hypothetical protein